jgi:hypothetical protein
VTVVTGADAAACPVDYRELFADAYVSELEAFVLACAEAGPTRRASPRTGALSPRCRSARRP